MKRDPATVEGFEWKRWRRAFGVAVLVMIAGGLFTAAGSSVIATWFPDRPVPRDLLFELLPDAAWTQYAVEAVYLASLALLVYYVWTKGHVRRVPEIMALRGVMDISRALIIVLTPLGVPYDEATHFNPTGGLMRQWGEFPSGHMATILLFYLVIDRDEAPAIKRVMLVLVCAEAVLLLTSRSHYSISIVGGLLLGYFIYHQYHDGRGFDWLKRLVRV